MTKIETDELRDIAGAVRDQRPDWDVGAILNVLLDFADRDPVQVRDAALRAAKNATSRTPLAIGFAQYWTAARSTPGVYRSEPMPECSSCGQPASPDISERLVVCPDCRAPWRPRVFRETSDGQRAVPPNAEFRAALQALRDRRLFGMPEGEPDLIAPPF